jgi:hypothetical protein
MLSENSSLKSSRVEVEELKAQLERTQSSNANQEEKIFALEEAEKVRA